jgi:transcriptional regulator with GAF, ATPase, and Fis domain
LKLAENCMPAQDPRDTAAVLAEYAQLLTSEHTVEHILDRLADFCTELLPVTTVGVLLRDERGGLHVATANSDVGQAIEALEVELAEGPCTESMTTGQQITVPDLEDATERYPRFAPKALDAGARSIHAVPLTVRVEQIGALNLIATEQIDLTAEQLSTAQLLADVGVSYIVNSRVLASTSELARQLQHALDSRVVLEQAKGVLAERHGITVTEAFQRLRAHARSRGAKLHEVAQDVVAGRARP